MIYELKGIKMNGMFIIIAEKDNTDVSSVVMGYHPLRPEWVTWVTDNEGNCSSGHYFASIHDAVVDYDIRCKD